MSSCARFEATLAEALAAPGPCDPLVRDALLRHAASCPACRSGTDLVELASEPSASRDPFPDPPPGYWERFGEALSARIAREERGRRVRRRRIAAIAASAAAVALTAGIVLRERPSRSETPRALPPLDEGAVRPDDPFEPFPAPGALGGFSEDDGTSLFSGADDLTPEDEERLLDWLRRETARVKGGAA